MGKSIALAMLKVLMILIFSGWIAIWLLKPTNLWIRKWKEAEDFAKPTVFGYYSLDFAVYTFPVIALAIMGFVYLNLLSKGKPRRRQARSSTIGFSNPVIVNSFVGILSGLEILAVLLFIIFLGWTFYTRISSDLKKLIPAKSLNLNLWQLKYLRVAIRFGLLSEACLALLLLPVLRGLALFQLLGIQFEDSVRYHVWLGTSLILFASAHGLSILFVWAVSHNLQDEIWRWQRTGRIYLAGEMALVTGLVIWITSLPQIRRKRFEIFYCTHHLYIVFLTFFLFHAGDRHFYAIFPGIFLFGLDKLLRIVQSRPEACILSARMFPNKAVELILPKHPSLKYTPTSVIYMKIPRISKFQWHSFSITSSSSMEDDVMSLVIKCEGEWTSSLYNMIQAELVSDAEHMSCVNVAIEGPYGPSSLDFLSHDSLLLIAGGSGITPFLSILKEIASAQSSSSSRYKIPTKIQLIYVVKNSQDICLLNSVSFLLLNESSKLLNLNLKVYVTQEQSSNVTLKELLNDLSLVQTVNFSTKCSNHAVHGLESLLWMASITALTSILFLVFLICFNHLFLPSEKVSASKKMAVRSEKKVAKEKTPSSVVDLLLLSSFVTALICSTFVAIILRWKRIKKQNSQGEKKPGKFTESSSVETRSSVEEHEIHFGGRPNFQEILSKFGEESGGCDIGVMVCGPESMKESVASFCKLKSQAFKLGAKGNKPYFSFHALNFTF